MSTRRPPAVSTLPKVTSAPEISRAQRVKSLGVRAVERRERFLPVAVRFAFTRRGLITGFVVVHLLMVAAAGPANSLRAMITGKFAVTPGDAS